jgi:predicted  nucleic acid-binding Zn-ribbon protein
MERKPRTLEQIQQTIKSARDSVWVINNEIEKLAAGQEATKERKGRIERNVGHLKLIVADQEIIDSGETIADLITAIAAGEAKLAEDIWPAEAAKE